MDGVQLLLFIAIVIGILCIGDRILAHWMPDENEETDPWTDHRPL